MRCKRGVCVRSPTERKSIYHTQFYLRWKFSFRLLVCVYALAHYLFTLSFTLLFMLYIDLLYWQYDTCSINNLCKMDLRALMSAPTPTIQGTTADDRLHKSSDETFSDQPIKFYTGQIYKSTVPRLSQQIWRCARTCCVSHWTCI